MQSADHRTTRLLVWEPYANGKGVLVRSADGSLAIHTWQTDELGEPLHSEGMQALCLDLREVIASFSMTGRSLDVFAADDVDGRPVSEILRSREPLLSRLEDRVGWDFST